MSSYLSPQFKYIIFHAFICKNGGRYVYRLTFIVVSANVLKSLSAIAFFNSSILLGTHTSDLNCKKRGMRNHDRTLLSWVNVKCGKRHFWVTCLCFKTSPWANPFIWKCVWFAWKSICRRNTFWYEWFRTIRLIVTQGNSIGTGLLRGLLLLICCS